MSQYTYYTLSDPPVEMDHYSEMKTWRVSKSPFGTRGQWFKDTDITMFLEDGVISDFEISHGTVVMDHNRCNHLFALLTEESWYLLAPAEYDIRDLKPTDLVIFLNNKNHRLTLLSVEADVGYVSFSSNTSEDIYAVSKEVYSDLKCFIERNT